jgi:hypothetical protein
MTNEEVNREQRKNKGKKRKENYKLTSNSNGPSAS